MITLNSFLDSYRAIKAKNASSQDFSTVTDYFTSKFNEISKMFSQMDKEALASFVNLSELKEYNDKDLVFSKDEKCTVYFFILYGDINFYEEKNIHEKNILIRTVSAGTVYGHKIKENYKFYTRARGKLSLLSVDKKSFDELIVNENKKKEKFKLNFIKKFFMHMRLFTDDVLNNILQFFIREHYAKYTRIFLDGEYDEYIYLIIKGEVGVAKKPNRIDLPITTNNEMNNYIILESFKRGDLFGGYSALKNMKCNYTALTLSEETEVYKISKSHLLFYFGGNNGFIPKALKALDTTQQMSHEMKIEYIKKECFSANEIQTLSEKAFKHNIVSFSKHIKNNKKTIDESTINNTLKDAWKSVENLDSQLSMFKASLLGGGQKKKVDIFSKMKETNDSKDYTKISGDATNRIVGRQLRFGLNDKQISSFNKLGAICGTKKKDDEEELKKLAEISNKMEGKKNNKLTDFDENMKQKPKEDKKFDIFLNNKTTTTTANPIDSDPLLTKAKKRNKISLKNLIE